MKDVKKDERCNNLQLVDMIYLKKICKGRDCDYLFFRSFMVVLTAWK